MSEAEEEIKEIEDSFKTFESFDKFGWDKFAQQLTEFIQTERYFVDGSLVISLNAEFGRGKSTFFEMWESMLNSSDGLPDVVRLNAWQSDFINDPLLAIAFNVVEHLEDNGKAPEVIKKIKTGAGKLCRATASIGNDIVSKFTGVDLVKTGKAAESSSLILDKKIGEQIYDDFRERTNALEDIRDGLKEAFTKEGVSNLIVIVDELDRCRPDYSISYLETIKHIFDIPKLTFVLGVDKVSLSCAAKALFGQDLKFDEYYRKFVHRNVTLPVPDMAATKQLCSSLVDEYMESLELAQINRFSYGEMDRYRIDNVTDLCVLLELTPRQIHEMFRVLGHALCCKEAQAGRMLWGWQISTMFMSALSFVNHDLYNQLGQGKASFEQLGDCLLSYGLTKNKERQSDWWCSVLFIAFANEDAWNIEAVLKEFQRLGLRQETFTDEEEKQSLDNLRKSLERFMSQGFGHDQGYESSILMKVYSRIEGLNQFAG